MDLSHLKGAARIEAAHQLHPWLAEPDHTGPLDLDRIADDDTLTFPGIYTIAGTIWGEPLTLYAGEAVCIADRIVSHFAGPEAFFRTGLQDRIEALETATGPCENITLSAWRIEGNQPERRDRERDALDALGAVLEYKDRRAATCLPDRIAEALDAHERKAVDQGRTVCRAAGEPAMKSPRAPNVSFHHPPPITP